MTPGPSVPPESIILAEALGRRKDDLVTIFGNKRLTPSTLSSARSPIPLYSTGPGNWDTRWYPDRLARDRRFQLVLCRLENLSQMVTLCRRSESPHSPGPVKHKAEMAGQVMHGFFSQSGRRPAK